MMWTTHWELSKTLPEPTPEDRALLADATELLKFHMEKIVNETLFGPMPRPEEPKPETRGFFPIVRLDGVVT